ncbi:MAG TPA: YceI family protein, partial [Candidatus Polarisedimenticolia bacterium]|nr:YceI family protein [Candidatus Polarisedimenticolia bacterium]
DRTMREKHLETGKHPDITFASTGAPRVISRADDPAGEPQRFVLEVSGALTIHGKSRPVTVEATAQRAEPGWQMTGTLLVRLSDHEIPDPSIFLNRVKNEVTVTFSIRMNPAP